MFEALARGAGGGPARGKAGAVIHRIVGIEESLGFLQRRLPVLIEVYVVVQVGFDRRRIATVLLRQPTQHLQPPTNLRRIPERRLPTLGVADDAPQDAADRLCIAWPWGVGDPDPRTRLWAWRLGAREAPAAGMGG